MMSVLGDPDGRSSDQVDAAFAQIVAGYDAPVEAVSWPASEDLPTVDTVDTQDLEPPAPAPRPTGPVWPAAGPVLNEPSILDGLDTFGDGLPDEDDEPFVPPPPPPLPRLSAQAIFGVLAIIGGLWLFFDTDLLPIGDQASMLLGLLGIIGGAVALIMRLRPGGPDDPDLPDDGAVV
jgi:hypothetical protein